ELSRVLLAVKRVLAESDPVDAYLFDEVDAGIGGATADAVGRALAAVARRRQIICITHLPQIAVFAGKHLTVEKEVVKGRTDSRLAVQNVEKELMSAKLRVDDPFSAQAPLPESPLAGALREAVEGACAAVFRTSRANPELAGMGTTCISLLVHGDHAIVGHVGDSRAYLVRDGQVWQLSEDHSLVNEQ